MSAAVQMAERSPAEILRAAKERISDPANWTQRKLARNHRSDPVKPDAPSACRFCAIGAVAAEGGDASPNTSLRLWLDRATRDVSSGRVPSIISLNDGGITRGFAHRRVLEAFDRAIELAGASA